MPRFSVCCCDDDDGAGASHSISIHCVHCLVCCAVDPWLVDEEMWNCVVFRAFWFDFSCPHAIRLMFLLISFSPLSYFRWLMVDPCDAELDGCAVLESGVFFITANAFFIFVFLLFHFHSCFCRLVAWFIHTSMIAGA